ncbi:hypothetical protein [Pseudonocardia ailaonensis]
MTQELRLVSRLHVDLCRTSVALCPGSPHSDAEVDLQWTGSAVRNWFG